MQNKIQEFKQKLNDIKPDDIKLKSSEVVTYISMKDWENKLNLAKEMYESYKESFEKSLMKDYGVSLGRNDYYIKYCDGNYYVRLIPLDERY